jgi:hypothetical protein
MHILFLVLFDIIDRYRYLLQDSRNLTARTRRPGLDDLIAGDRTQWTGEPRQDLGLESRDRTAGYDSRYRIAGTGQPDRTTRKNDLKKALQLTAVSSYVSFIHY